MDIRFKNVQIILLKHLCINLWQENYPVNDRKRIKKEINRIISTLKNSVEKHKKDGDFIKFK